MDTAIVSRTMPFSGDVLMLGLHVVGDVGRSCAADDREMSQCVAEVAPDNLRQAWPRGSSSPMSSRSTSTDCLLPPCRDFLERLEASLHKELTAFSLCFTEAAIQFESLYIDYCTNFPT